jgi:hypothetical protein
MAIDVRGKDCDDTYTGIEERDLFDPEFVSLLYGV